MGGEEDMAYIYVYLFKSAIEQCADVDSEDIYVANPDGLRYPYTPDNIRTQDPPGRYLGIR